MKYFIFDLDDTILNDKKEVSEFTLKGIEILKENNYLIVINTARSFAATLPIIDIIKPDYSICNAGSTIYDKNKKIIYSKTISVKDTNEIITLIKKSSDINNYSIQTINNLYSSDIKYATHNPLVTICDFDKELNEEAVKILVASWDKEKWRIVSKNYGYEFENYFNGLWSRISPSNKYLGNIALFEVLKDNNPLDYVFGDDFGDVEMIVKAYHGVLMINSKIEELDCYKTLEDNNSDGVIKYMLGVLKKNL